MENEVGQREPMDKTHTVMIAKALGLGAVILDLHLTDYSRGSMKTKDGRCFWLTDERRVDISTVHGGGVIASTTREPDPDRPEPFLKEG